MKRNKTIGLSVLVFTLLLFTSSRCCETDYCRAIRDAVVDDKITNEEVIALKQAYADYVDMEIDSISDWSDLIEDVFSQLENISRSELEKVFYPKRTRVIVYLDNTCSMEGYALASDPRAFTSIFDAISTFYSADSTATVEARYVSKDNVAEKVDFNVMCNALTGHNWAKEKNKKYSYTDAYQMDDLFGAISNMVMEADRQTEEVICFFVSDMIPSTENENIRGDRQYMLHFSERIVTMMTDRLRPLASNENLFAASLYQFFAPFGGNEKDKNGKYLNEAIYYKFTNGHLKLYGENRPIYVMAIGNNNAVRAWNEKVLSGLHNFSPVNYAFIGGAICDIVPTGYAKIDGNRIVFTVDKNEKEVYLDIDLNSIPSYLTVEDSAIIVTLNGKLCSDMGNGRIKIGRLDNVDGGTLRIQVKDIAPEWVRNSSTDDDSGLIATDAIGMAQTFYLERVFHAIVQGLYNSDGRTILYDKSYVIEIE